jgi:hypothetical protein
LLCRCPWWVKKVVKESSSLLLIAVGNEWMSERCKEKGRYLVNYLYLNYLCKCTLFCFFLLLLLIMQMIKKWNIQRI